MSPADRDLVGKMFDTIGLLHSHATLMKCRQAVLKLESAAKDNVTRAALQSVVEELQKINPE
jgi:hypothetical protein